MLKKLLAHPLTRGLDLDAPETTALRIRLIQEKIFLRRLYLEWYTWLQQALVGTPPGPLLELGSGGGFLRAQLPDLLASDVFLLPNLSAVLNALHLPFHHASLRGIVMTNVLHHLPHARQFFTEAARCVKTGGKIAMIEPWHTHWSAWIYTHLHHEPFDPTLPAWEFPSTGPLSSANGALPWILFHRDREIFQTALPEWEIIETTAYLPFRYLLSGGVSLRALVPGWTFDFFRRLEDSLTPWHPQIGMFAKIVLQRR